MYFLEQIKNQFISCMVSYQEAMTTTGGENIENKNKKPEDIGLALKNLKDDINVGDLSSEKMSEYSGKIKDIHTLIDHVRSKIQPVESVNNDELDEEDLVEISDLSAKQYELKRTLFEFDEQLRDIERTLETIVSNKLSKQELKEYQTKTNVNFLSLPVEERLRFITVGNIDAKTLENQEFQGLEFTFTYDGVFNKELYIRTTAGQVLPEKIRQVRSGNEVFFRKGLNGEFFTEGGKRLKIHEGTKIDIEKYADQDELDEIIGSFTKDLNGFSKIEKPVALAALKKGIDPKFFLLLSGDENFDFVNDGVKIEDKLTDIARYEDDFMDYFPGNSTFRDGRVTEEFAGYVIQLLSKDGKPFIKEYGFKEENMKKFVRISQSPGLGGGIDMSNVNVDDISPEELKRILNLKRYIPRSKEAVVLFTAAAQAAGLPESWAKNPKLHYILQKESAGGQVGILNYTITQNTNHNTESFRDISMRRRVRNPIGVRSTASGLGQLTLSNVDMFYPEGRAGIGDSLNEAVGMMRYIRDRYGDVDTAYSVYGRKGTFTHAVTGKRRPKTFKEGY